MRDISSTKSGMRPMAGKVRQSGKQVAFKAAAIANVPFYEVQLADTLLDEIVSVLGKGEDPWDSRLRAILPNQARSYLMAKALLNADSPHESRKAIMRMVVGLTTALDAMEEIGDGPIDGTGHPSGQIRRTECLAIADRDPQHHRKLPDIAASWTEMYKPRDRRPRNRALESHVGALMCLFEGVTGNRATAALKRAGSHTPRLTSPEAHAIHLLLSAVDEDATETAIANKIVEIGKERKGKSLGCYAPILLAGAPAYAVP
jgi:hypothetical protein